MIFDSKILFFQAVCPPLDCPNREKLAIALIGECYGSNAETEALNHWQEGTKICSRQSQPKVVSIALGALRSSKVYYFRCEHLWIQAVNNRLPITIDINGDLSESLDRIVSFF